MPRHVNPTNPDRTATAPYNFVPLPKRVFDVADGIQIGGEMIKPWEMHDRFVSGTNSGSIEVTIETLTPLFIRGAVGQRQDGAWDDRDSRLRPEPYTTPDGRPAIPGSSLRGMVRTLVEILSFSKIQPVDAGRPFFRTVAPDRVGRAYGERMRRGVGVRGGRLQRQGNDWSILACEVLRVKRSIILPNRIHQGNRPNWAHQHRRCWVDVDSNLASSIAFASDKSKKPGHLVLTGDVPGKKREFVFLDPTAHSERVVIPQSIWDRFHDDDQITQWQETAFPRNQPQGGGRTAPGHLRDGEPVFFLSNNDAQSEDNPNGLVFLGRAGMFRFPYDTSPAELVPRELREARLDLAEAIFGKVDRSSAIKGRVHFEDAVAPTAGPDAFEAALVPQILSAPKPTTFQHYLTQDGTKGREHLTTYLDGDHTTIRGHKLYWHRNSGGVSQIKEPNRYGSLLQDLQQANPQDTQHTVIRPVKRGVTFLGRVRFENLTDLELGALLHALRLPDDCAHRLGMGKPLGLGSLRITAHLAIVNRADRYRAWQTSDIQSDDGSRFRCAFSEALLHHARSSHEPMQNGQQGLRQIARLDVLFRMLEWANHPNPEATAYMELARFRARPVLPTPHHIAQANEPPWPADLPRPAPGEQGGLGTSGGQYMGTPERREVAPPALPAHKPIQKGQTREGILKRCDGGWVAVFDGDPREAQVINPGKINPGLPDQTTAEFFITEQSKSAGIKCRFERMTEAAP